MNRPTEQDPTRDVHEYMIRELRQYDMESTTMQEAMTYMTTTVADDVRLVFADSDTQPVIRSKTNDGAPRLSLSFPVPLDEADIDKREPETDPLLVPLESAIARAKIDIMLTKEHLWSIAILLSEHCGEEYSDLALAALSRGVHLVSKNSRSAPSLRDPHPSVEEKKRIMDTFLPLYRDAQGMSHAYTVALDWVFGSKRANALVQNPATFGAELRRTVDTFMRLLRISSTLRRKVLRELKADLMTDQRFIASAALSAGFDQLMHIPEVTDYEWWERRQSDCDYSLKHYLKLNGSDDTYASSNMPDITAILTQEELTVHLLRECHVYEKRNGLDKLMLRLEEIEHCNEQRLISERYLQQHKPETAERELADAISCDQSRRELENIRATGAHELIAAKEREILHKVFGALRKYVDTRERDPGYIAGYPVTVTKRKHASCFSGIWLLASMLMRCGISETKLKYCSVFKHGSRNDYGMHGNLLMGNANAEWTFADFGYGYVGQNFHSGMCVSPDMWKDARSVMLGESDKPVRITIHPEHARMLRIPSDFQLMSLTNGIGSVHLLHTGIDLLHQDKLEEAIAAFQIGLSFNAHHPDLLYNLGLAYFRQGNPSEARAYFDDVLAMYPAHLHAHFSLGELELHEGNTAEANEHFQCVCNDPRNIYSGNEIREKADRYLQDSVR